jgi:hypothetical protein
VAEHDRQISAALNGRSILANSARAAAVTSALRTGVPAAATRKRGTEHDVARCLCERSDREEDHMFHAPASDSKQEASSTTADPPAREQDWQPDFDGPHALAACLTEVLY